MFKTYPIAAFFENPRLKDMPFHINRLESMKRRATALEHPHKHNFYEIFIVKKGSARQSVDYQEFDLHDNMLFIISQGQLHFWEESHEVLEGYRLMFTEDFLLMNQANKNLLFELIYLDNVYQHPAISISETHDKILEVYFNLLLKEYERKDAQDHALGALLLLILTELQRLFNAHNYRDSTKYNVIIYKQFITLLENNFALNLSASDYAEKLCLSPRHFNRIVQNVSNQSVTQIIKNRIVLEAKRLLSFTNLTVSEISTQLNFEDPSYFARYFKKTIGLSPIEFKNNMSQKYRK